MRPGRLRATAAVGLLVASLAAAPAQTAECPENSQAPRCLTDPAEPAPAEEPAADKDERPAPTQRPTTPPGRETEPSTGNSGDDPGSAPGRTEDPQPDRGSDQPASTPGTTDPGSSPSGGRGGGTDDAPGREPATDEETGAPIPPPPPDLGARRVLASRLVPGPRGLELAVEVVEARARGVDGGWTVTVAGRPPAPAAVVSHPRQPAGPVGLIIGRDGSGTVPGFSVVGQRSTTVYDADYRGVVPIGPASPAVITVTLFQ